jgi:carboxylesterase type B
MVGQTVDDLAFGPFGPAWRTVRHLVSVRPADEDSEDCLTLDVQRPATLSNHDALEDGGGWPVLVWIFGGAFEVGGAFLYMAPLSVAIAR